MNTFLLILNLIVGLLILFEGLYIKRDMEYIKDEFDIDLFSNLCEPKPIISIPNIGGLKREKLNTERVNLNKFNIGNLRRPTEEVSNENEDKIIMDIDNTFKNVYDFIEYVSEYNLEVIDVASRKIRKIKYLDNCVCNNQETVRITFEDHSEAVFIPFLYAKCS